MFARKQNSVLGILHSINQKALQSKKIKVKSRTKSKRNRTLTQSRARRKLRPADARSRYMSVSKDGQSEQSEKIQDIQQRQTAFYSNDDVQREETVNDFILIDPDQCPEAKKEVTYDPRPSLNDRVSIEMRCNRETAQKSSQKKRKSTCDPESPPIEPKSPIIDEKACKSRETSPIASVHFGVFDEDRRCTVNCINPPQNVCDSIAKMKFKKKKRKSQVRRRTKVVSFHLSDFGEVENFENKENKGPDDCEVSQLVNSQEKSPFKKCEQVKEMNKSPEKIETESEDMEFNDIHLDTNGCSRNELPKLRLSKSIERLNRLKSPRNKVLADNNFKLIGVDLRESLKNKIDQSVTLHKNQFLQNMKKGKGSGFSLKLNEVVRGERKSNLKKFIETTDLSPNGKKNFECFVEQTKEKRVKVTGTLRKIFNNSVNRRSKHKSRSNLQSFISTQSKTLDPIADEEIKKKIKTNQNILRFNRELRQVYDTRKLLHDISVPYYSGYLGYFFRKCYWEHTSQKEEENLSCVSENFHEPQKLERKICTKSRQKSEPDLSARIPKNLDTPFLPYLSEEWKKIHHEHLIESLQSYQYLNDLKTPKTPPMIKEEDYIKPISGKKLLIFDMDETLIHCIPDAKHGQKCEVKIPVKYSDKISYKYINLRPYVRECLKELSLLYQIIVFTASTQDYADPILDYLDKDKLDKGQGLIKKRYYRRHCYKTKENCTMKDLRIFEKMGYDMKDVILVDNATHCFGFQVTNGIPMVPFFKNTEDLEMIHILHFLKEIAEVHDVRPIFEKTFMLPKLRRNSMLERIEGVIEQCVEEVDDDFFLEDKPSTIKQERTTRRETMSNCTLEEVCSEGVEATKINTLMRTLPKAPVRDLNLSNYRRKVKNVSRKTPEVNLEEFDIIETVVLEC
ncbi:unnamed protein product [Moneuplotes crassus]|uniref:FCP1 homology domain-containing protein n=1 Tax=Euplotes crassus TaxID=5936 RepID=A0AAD2D6B9_EUPCR|nr:unnamed protein product [Moneuplotes crassus]